MDKYMLKWQKYKTYSEIRTSLFRSSCCTLIVIHMMSSESSLMKYRIFNLIV